MSLGGAIGAAVPYLRAQAESTMTDSCTITRPATSTFNTTTGAYATTTTPIYTGRCRIRTRSTNFLRDKESQAGEQLAVIWPYIVSIPATASDVQVSDIVTLTAADPLLNGKTLRVRIANAGTSTTARRLDCEEVADG